MGNVGNTLDIWQHQLNQSATDNGDIESGANVIQHTIRPEVSLISNLCNDTNDNNLACNDEMEYVLLTNIKSLTDDQWHAYDIADWHARETIIGNMPPQLLMMIPGEGGVGKSRLIQTMTQNFQVHNVSHWWVKGAYI